MHRSRPSQGADSVTNTDLVAFRLERVEDAIMRLTATTEQLARIDERLVENRASMERAFGAIKEHGQRLSTIEHQLPELRRSSGWVYAAAVAVVVAAFTFMWRTATVHRPADPAPAVGIVQRAEGEKR